MHGSGQFSPLAGAEARVEAYRRRREPDRLVGAVRGEEFWPQPYTKLAAVLREMGHGEDARAVRIRAPVGNDFLQLLGHRCHQAGLPELQQPTSVTKSGKISLPVTSGLPAIYAQGFSR